MSKHSHHTEFTSLNLPVQYLGNPMSFVEEYFFYETGAQALATLHDHFMAIFNPKRRKKLTRQGGSNALFATQMLAKLLDALWLIWQEDTEQTKGAIPAQFQEPAHLFTLPFFTSQKESDPWTCVPCHLTQDEFFTPMIVVGKFFKRKSLTTWKRLLDEAVHNILSDGTPDFGDSYTNPYEVHFHLASLIEAAFLIHIRHQEYYLNFIKSLETPSQEPVLSPPSTDIDAAANNSITDTDKHEENA